MRQHDSFANSGLGRAKPKKHLYHSFINSKLKRQRSQIGLVEDSTSSTTIVRIIIGLLMLHLVIIGGVLLKGHFDKLAGGVAVSPTMTPPPAAAQQAEEVLPQPTVPAAAPAPVASTATHITQPTAAAQQPELFPEETTAPAAAPAAEPVVVAAPVVEPAPAVAVEPAAPAAPAPAQEEKMTTIKHLVNSGDTWYGVAQQYNTTIDALKAANPTAARKAHLYQGSYISVPVKEDSAAAQAAATAAPAEEAAAIYKVKRGDTLGKIARKHKMSLPALMKLNGFTDKDAGRLKIGQEIKVSK